MSKIIRSKKYLTLEEVAVELGISFAHAKKMVVVEGSLAHVKLGRSYWIPEESITDYLALGKAAAIEKVKKGKEAYLAGQTAPNVEAPTQTATPTEATA